MRIAPTAVEQTGTAGDYKQFTSNFGAATCTGVPTYSNITTNLIGAVTTTVASGLVAGNWTGLHATATAAYLGWSAEL